ncbi:MAG: hypothetical protein AAGJ74_09340 [Pseudomonadota bacterium]
MKTLIKPTVRLINALFYRLPVAVVYSVRELKMLSGLLIFAMVVGTASAVAAGIATSSFVVGLIVYSLSGTAVMLAAMGWVGLRDYLEERTVAATPRQPAELQREAA